MGDDTAPDLTVDSPPEPAAPSDTDRIVAVTGPFLTTSFQAVVSSGATLVVNQQGLRVSALDADDLLAAAASCGVTLSSKEVSVP